MLTEWVAADARWRVEGGPRPALCPSPALLSARSPIPAHHADVWRPPLHASHKDEALSLRCRQLHASRCRSRLMESVSPAVGAGRSTCAGPIAAGISRAAAAWAAAVVGTIRRATCLL